jgi:hypothetical protein
METDKLSFAVDRAGDRKWRHSRFPVRNYVVRNIRPSGAFSPEVTSVTWRTGRGPVWKYVLRMPVFPPRFFLRSSTMATGCDLRSLDPFGVPVGVRMNTRSDQRWRDPFGSVLGVFSRTFASYYQRKPPFLFSYSVYIYI